MSNVPIYLNQGATQLTIGNGGKLVVAAGGLISTTDTLQGYEDTGYIRANRYDTNYKTGNPTPTITFQVDDNKLEDYTYTYPMAKARGVAFCTAVVTSLVGLTGRNTWDNIAEMVADGWEVLSHTVNHYNTHDDGFWMGELTEAEIISELADSKAAIEAQGFTCESFVNPAHETSEVVQGYISRYYRSARSYIVLPTNPSVIPTYKLCCYNISDVADGTDDGTTLAAAKALVDDLAGTNQWLIFYLHDSTEAGAAAVGELIDYIQTAEIDILTTSQALDKHENIIETGVLPSGEGFGVAANGDIRCGEIAAMEGVTIHSRSYPFTNTVSVNYYLGDLELKPQANDKCVRPPGWASDYSYRGLVDLGKTGYEWNQVWCKGIKDHLADWTLKTGTTEANLTTRITVTREGATTITDLSAGNGATGSFTTVDSKTVTVTNGIITAIA